MEQYDPLVLHAVVIPYPTQGHITPHLQLARHLVRMHGFFITFVNTTHNHERMMEAQAEAGYNPESNAKINFVGVPDGLPTDDRRFFDITHFLRAVLAMGPVFEEFLRNLMMDFPITCIIRDVAMSCVHEPARCLGIPIVGFATCAAIGVYCYQHIATFRDRGFIPIPGPADIPSVNLKTGKLRPALSVEEATARARLLTGFPGLSPIMRVEDLPTYLVTHDMSDSSLRFFLENRNPLIPKCDWVFLNTFYELEPATIDALRDDGINICPIGPLVFTPHDDSTKSVDSNQHELEMAKSGSAIWIEDIESIPWLDKQPPSSVIYVSFGSLATISLQQAQELARGLEMSGHRFMWVVRPDLARKGEGNKEFVRFFLEFVERTRERSLIVPWVSQPEILIHPAITAFLTHCGWNSTLESICGGVPILAWPQAADQQTNARYIMDVWRIGLGLECHRLDGLVVRDEVAKKVRRIMTPMGGDDQEVNMLRMRSKELEVAAHRAASQGGSSHRSMASLLDEMKNILREPQGSDSETETHVGSLQAPQTIPV